jgi:hypothetical protein
MFKIREDCKSWFGNIAGPSHKPLSTYFDAYYFCLMIGFSHGRRAKAENGKGGATDLVDYFVEAYTNSRELILGLLLTCHLNDQAIAMTESKEVQRVCAELFTAQDSARLTKVGFNIMNEYASAGYQILAEECASKPHTTAGFYHDYAGVLAKGIRDNPNWSKYVT